MSSEKTLAIVIRVIDFSETSCIVTLFTRDFGKIGALAKGARRPKSPFEAAIDLLALCRIVFLHKSSDTLNLLTEAKLERRFRSGSRDLLSLYAGYYVAELLKELTDEGDPYPELFETANEVLQGLDHGLPTGRLILRFELAALQQLGHMPSLYDCVGCGNTVDLSRQSKVQFGMLSGGLLCARCRVGQRNVVQLQTRSIDVLRTFGEAGDAWRTCLVPPGNAGELRGVINQYISHLIGKKPRLHAFIHRGLTARFEPDVPR